PKNVVLITVESLSAEFVGAYGSQKGLTPRLDQLAAAGLMFENAYATGTRSVRGLEALSLGTPPIPGQAIPRRPNNGHLMTIGQFMAQARSQSWFNDTLFVSVPDHCASVAGNTQLPVARYRIPLIFYAPDMLKPGVFSKMVSQIDLPPTLLDLLEAKGDDHYF